MSSADDRFSDHHGRLLCGTISVSNLDRSIALYTGDLAYTVIDSGVLDSGHARCWGTLEVAGTRFALLQPGSGHDSYLRLVESPAVSDFVPARTFGWSAFEICVADVFELAKKISVSEFEIVGPPKLVDGFTSFIPMQVYGPDGEILFLNQVNHSDDDVDLPIAQSDVDRIFIVVLGAADRESCVADVVTKLALDRAGTHRFRYSLINRAFDLPPQTQQTITMIQNDRTPFAQIDQLPEAATVRSQHVGWLPPGNSMVTIEVDNLDALQLDDAMIDSPTSISGPMYDGRRVASIRIAGCALLELVETQPQVSLSEASRGNTDGSAM